MRRCSVLLGLGLLTLILSCGDTKTPEHKIPARKAKKPKTALDLIRKDDCLTCHSISEKSAGPSYMMVAERYETTPATIDKLAQKILDGGGGTWGMGQMVKHQFLKVDEAKTIVKWILDLDISQKQQKPALSLAEIQSNGENLTTDSGIVIQAYSLTEYVQDFRNLETLADVHISGNISKIHLLSNTDFLPMKGPFYLLLTSELDIEKSGKYFFRVDNRGFCQLSIDEQSVITNNEWDSEAWVQLDRAIHNLKLEYLSVPDDNRISLEWIDLTSNDYQLFEK